MPLLKYIGMASWKEAIAYPSRVSWLWSKYAPERMHLQGLVYSRIFQDMLALIDRAPHTRLFSRGKVILRTYPVLDVEYDARMLLSKALAPKPESE